MNPSRWCSACVTPRDSLMTLSPLLSTYGSVRGPVLRGLPQLLDPPLVIGFRVDIDPPDHTGMPWTAQFSAGFFFQAEDGIRDADVTGVQTCALPICASSMVTAAISPSDATLTPSSTA